MHVIQHAGAYRHQYCCWLGVADIAIASHNNDRTYALHINFAYYALMQILASYLAMILKIMLI